MPSIDQSASKEVSRASKEVSKALPRANSSLHKAYETRVIEQSPLHSNGVHLSAEELSKAGQGTALAERITSGASLPDPGKTTTLTLHTLKITLHTTKLTLHTMKLNNHHRMIKNNNEAHPPTTQDFREVIVISTDDESDQGGDARGPQRNAPDPTRGWHPCFFMMAFLENRDHPLSRPECFICGTILANRTMKTSIPRHHFSTHTRCGRVFDEVDLTRMREAYLRKRQNRELSSLPAYGMGLRNIDAARTSFRLIFLAAQTMQLYATT